MQLFSFCCLNLDDEILKLARLFLKWAQHKSETLQNTKHKTPPKGATNPTHLMTQALEGQPAKRFFLKMYIR